MKTINLKSNNGTEHIITLYDSVEQLPGRRYNAFNKWSLMAAGIGSTIADVDRHHARLDMFLQAGRSEQALQERYQLQNAFHLAINEINPTHLCFACLVAEVDGQPQNDLSQEGLQKVCDLLSDLDFSSGELETTLAAVKKKLRPS